MWWKWAIGVGLTLMAGLLIALTVARFRGAFVSIPVKPASSTNAPPVAPATALGNVTGANSMAGNEEQGAVYEWTDSEMSGIGNYDQVIVLFYAPWCGYCKKMFPEFARAAVSDNADQGRVWAQVDATQFQQLANQYGVEAFPTTIVFSRGQVKQVIPGAQTAEALKNVIQ